jgi:hypothetical protein
MRTAEQIKKQEEKDGLVRWVFIDIMLIPLKADGTSDYSKKQRLFTFDLPREVYERREWVVRWRVAKLQCLYPRNYITPYFTYYCKKTKLPIYKGVLDKMISAKRMITTILNKMEEAKKEYIPTLYNPTIESTEEWVKVSAKLKQYREKLLYFTAEVERVKNLPTGDKPFIEEAALPCSSIDPTVPGIKAIPEEKAA